MVLPFAHTIGRSFLMCFWGATCVNVSEREREKERERSWWHMPCSLTLSFPVLQRHNGDIFTTASVKHLSHRRFVVSFQLESVQRTDQDLYRCVTQSPKGSGVSNFAELIVKGKALPSSSCIVLFLSFSPFCFCYLIHQFSTWFLWKLKIFWSPWSQLITLCDSKEN